METPEQGLSEQGTLKEPAEFSTTQEMPRDGHESLPTPAPSQGAAQSDISATEAPKRSAPPTKPRRAKRTKTSHDIEFTEANVDSLFSSDPLNRPKIDSDELTPFFSENARRDKAMRELRSTKADPKEVKALNEACKVFGHMQMQVAGGNMFKLQHMKTPLFPHQLLGTAKIRTREKADIHPRSGIFADEMGLGKTIQMLANILNGYRDSKEAKKGKTLIVANGNLLNMWEGQIEKHINNPGKKLGLHCRYSASNLEALLGSNKHSAKAVINALKMFSVILTTYNEVSASFPHDSSPQLTGDFEQDQEIEARWQKDLHKKKGPLHRIKWHRVIFDEAHAIKNHLAQRSMACHALEATHYWPISGTPFQNNISEAYSYFLLFRMPHTESMKIFNQHYPTGKNGELSNSLKTILEKLMVRRTYNDRILGAPVVQIPPTHSETVVVQPKQIESALYQWLEAYFKRKIDGVRNNHNLTEEEKRELVLAMIQRLRHMVMHWFLATDILGEGDLDLVKDLIKEFGPNVSTAQLNRMITYITKLCGRNGKYSQKRQVKEKKERKIVKERESQWREIGLDLPKALKKVSKRLDKPKFSIKQWYKSKGSLLHSSKTQAVVNEIAKRLDKDPARKFVVFTQSIEMIRILAEHFKVKGWGYLQYHGGMSQKTRANALTRFDTESGLQIFIMSLLAGGEGLNLTAASCVINMDLWWNAAKERQGYSRVVRIGQTKETDIIRIVLDYTIDIQIMAKQQQKQVAINAAMKAGSKHAKGWTLSDLAELLEKDAGPYQSTSDFFNANVKWDTTAADGDVDKEDEGDDDSDAPADEEDDDDSTSAINSESDSDADDDDEDLAMDEQIAPTAGNQNCTPLPKWTKDYPLQEKLNDVFRNEPKPNRHDQSEATNDDHDGSGDANDVGDDDDPDSLPGVQELLKVYKAGSE